MKKQLADARQTPFVWFDIALDDAHLTPYEFRLYCRIARRTAGGKTSFFEALTHAAAACRMSERQARYAIKGLLRYRMVKCLQKMPGYPTIYALTDKSEWLLPPPAPNAALHEVQPPLHLMQPSPAPDAAPPAPDAGVPLHHVPTKKTHGRRTQKKTQEAEAARARANGTAAAAASRFTEIEILEFLTATKPHNAARNSGLAHKLYLTGEDDHLIAHWQQQQAHLQAELRRQAEHDHAEHLRVALDLADSLLCASSLDVTERSYIPGLIETLSTHPRHTDVVEQLKGLTHE